MPDYPDTADGARRLLREDGDPNVFTDLEDARLTPDAYVNGAWLAQGPDWAVVIYVGSHPLAPSFEDVDPEQAADRYGGASR